MKQFFKKRLPYWQLYLFLLIPVAYIITFAYVPMAGLQIAFKKFDLRLGITGSPWVGLEYIIKFITAYQFQRVLVNTVSIQLYGLIAEFPFPIIFALVLNTIHNKRLKKTIQTITYMPYFISVVVLVSMMMQLFNPLTGVYGSVSRFFTGHAPDDLFGSPAAYPHLFVWSYIWQNFGYSSIIYIAALSTVNPDLHEAAQIDGASRLQRIRHVDIPCILPTVVIMLILRMGQLLNMGFEKSYLMQNSLNLRKSEVISTFIYKKGLGSGSSNDYSYATAVGMFNSVINTFLILTVNSISKKVGETSLW